MFLHERTRKTTALLLLAVMAMLPFHGLQASRASLSHHQGDEHSPTQHLDHVMMDGSGMHACQMHDQAAGQASHDHHHCDSSGCDMCGACSADLPREQCLSLSHDRFLPDAEHPAGRPVSRLTLLYRPPRA